MKFFTSAIAIALCAALVAADIAAVKQDIKDIDAGVKSLSAAFPADPESINYFSALAIHNNAGNFDKLIRKAAADVQALKENVSDADGQEAIDALTVTEASIKTTIAKLIAAQPKFTKLGVAVLGKKDVEDLAASTKLFGSALVAKSPASKKVVADALLAKVNADIQAGVDAFNPNAPKVVVPKVEVPAIPKIPVVVPVVAPKVPKAPKATKDLPKVGAKGVVGAKVAVPVAPVAAGAGAKVAIDTKA